MKIQTWFDIENGVKLYHFKDKYQDLSKNLKDGRYIETIESVGRIRSNPQNNTYWGIAYMYMKQGLINAGIFKDPSDKQVHEWCMVNCLPEDYKERIYNAWELEPAITNLKTGKTYKEPFRLTSTMMHTIDGIHYYENMQMMYAENFSSGEENDFIPDPEPSKRKR